MSFTTYLVTSIEEFAKVLEDLPDEMKVEIAEGVNFKAATVRELRDLGSFPSGHDKPRIITPREWDRPSDCPGEPD